MFGEENLSAPKDKAAANAEEVEDCEDWVFFGGKRLSWRALARAFSCVLTKLARF